MSQVLKHPLPIGTVINAYTPIGRTLQGTPLHGFVTAKINSIREWKSPNGRVDYFYTVDRKGKALEIPQTNVHSIR